MPSSDDDIRAATVGEPQRLDGPITLVDYDPRWPELFASEAARIGAALGEALIALEHVGSTSVPGLAAKPIIDMLLVVADSGEESAYLPPLERAGYVLRIREPDWYQHRVLKGPDTNVNLHVFSAGCVEITRMLGFRDHLRSNTADREAYEAAKCELAAQQWRYVQNYADAKTDVIEAMIARARRAAS